MAAKYHPGGDYVTIGEAAIIAQTHYQTIRNWMSASRLSITVIKDKKYLSRKEILDFIKPIRIPATESNGIE